MSKERESVIYRLQEEEKAIKNYFGQRKIEFGQEKVGECRY